MDPPTKTDLDCASRPIRLVLCDDSAGPSGLSRYITSLLNGLNDEEFDVHLFCREAGPYADWSGIQRIFYPGGEGEHSNAISSSELRPASRFHSYLRETWRNAATPAAKRWLGFYRNARHLGRILKKTAPDLLYGHICGPSEVIVGARIAGIANIVGTFHLGPAVSRYSDWPLEMATNHCLDVGISVSENVRRQWLRRTRMSGHRIVTIHNGVDVARFRRQLCAQAARRSLGLPETGIFISSVGRLTEQKGFRDLLAAVRQLLGQGLQIHIILAGEGPLRNSLQAEANCLGIGNYVHLIGQRAEIQSVYDAADIFALPSHYEAMPYALLEAMASGLPVVATAVDGVPEVVVNGKTGFLIPPRAPSFLAASLRQLAGSAALREQLGSQGREHIQRFFSEFAMVQQTADLFRKIACADWAKPGRDR